MKLIFVVVFFSFFFGMNPVTRAASISRGHVLHTLWPHLAPRGAVLCFIPRLRLAAGATERDCFANTKSTRVCLTNISEHLLHALRPQLALCGAVLRFIPQRWMAAGAPDQRHVASIGLL